VCAGRALAIVEEPACAQAPIHLRPQLRQTACDASRDQPHLPLDVSVTVDRRGDDRAQLVDRHPGDQLLDWRLGFAARGSTGHRSVARRALVA
jgi:hypothetical protein